MSNCEKIQLIKGVYSCERCEKGYYKYVYKVLTSGEDDFISDNYLYDYSPLFDCAK